MYCIELFISVYKLRLDRMVDCNLSSSPAAHGDLHWGDISTSDHGCNGGIYLGTYLYVKMRYRDLVV